MDFLQNIDSGSVILIALGLGALCVIGVILPLATQIFSGILGVFGSATALLGGFVAEPTSCCGCIGVIGFIIVCGIIIAGIASALGTCGTPDAINFCALIGRG